jgi:hypothetical protein
LFDAFREAGGALIVGELRRLAKITYPISAIGMMV